MRAIDATKPDCSLINFEIELGNLLERFRAIGEERLIEVLDLHVTALSERQDAS